MKFFQTKSRMRAPDSENNNEYCSKYSINDLPDEIIEFVLSFVPPYRDLHDCMLVCKRWRTNVLNVARIKRRQLQASLSNFNIQWQIVKPVDKSPSITKRYSHSAVVHENSMYVFGGCTNSMTTFNDLWRLDLSTRQWVRPLASGIYPTPKACSSMVCYKDSLVLFGGWAYPSSFPFHQSYQLFNELHLYDITSNKWSFVSLNNPPPMAGHSVSVHGDWMVVFGGMQRCKTTGNTVRTNDVWILNLQSLVWQKQEINGIKPSERYGQSQTVLDDNHILIMGGCGGPNGLFTDAWLLKMKGELWEWKRVEMKQRQWAPSDTWCHPTCKVGNYIVMFNRSRSLDHIYHVKNCWRPPGDEIPETHRQHRPVDRDVNVNGRRGFFNTRRFQSEAPPNPSTSRSVQSENNNIKIRDCPRASGLSLSAFSTAKSAKAITAGKNREKQLELLRRMENILKSRNRTDENDSRMHSFVKKHKKNKMELYLLDVSHALDEIPHVSWVAPKNSSDGEARYSGPEETLLYTLVQGKGELIMFGGIQKDNAPAPYNMLSAEIDPCSYSTKVSNSLHFICPPNDII